MLNKLLPHRNGHTWRFFRAGGLDQVRLETGADIANLEKLDQKLWVALACPVKGLESDEKTLTLLDTDKDGRIRVPEVLAGIAFCREHLKNLDCLVAGEGSIALADFNDATPAGKVALACAKEVLKSQGKENATALSLADICDSAAIFAKATFNGDGVLTADATVDAELKQVFADILATVGGSNDRGGAVGVGQVNMDAFFAESAAFDAWHQTAQDAAAQVLPFGTNTAAAAAALTAISAKVNDYFARCRLAAFDPRALAAVNRNEADYLTLAAQDMTISSKELASFPLARIEAGRALPLVIGVNPAWAAAAAALNTEVLALCFGGCKDSLTEQEWAQVQGKLAAHLAWIAAKPASKVEALGLARARTILASNAKVGLDALIAQDKACEGEFNKIADLEKLVRLHRDLFRLLHNFTNFDDFYSPDKWSSFQAGTLYLDSRSCDLVIRVEDAGKHGAMAHLSKCYLAYCDCTRPGGEKLSVVAIFSGGDSDYLMVGRNGVFYDRKGQDWDATITKIVDNPISIRQAFFSPYKKLAKMVDDMIAKRAASADAEANAKLAANATAPAAPEHKKIDLGTIALVGSVLAAMTTFVLSFFNLGGWIPLALIGIMMAISGPSMILAGMKLRQRTLGPILDANGWAINSRVRVNIPFGGSLTKLPEFPAGSERSLLDPYQQKRSPLWYVAAAGILAMVGSLGTVLCYERGCLPDPVMAQLRVLGVPQYLNQNKVLADAKVKELSDGVAPKELALASAKAARIEILKAPSSNPQVLADAQKDYDNALNALTVPRTKLAEAQAVAARIDAKIAFFTPPLPEMLK